MINVATRGHELLSDWLFSKRKNYNNYCQIIGLGRLKVKDIRKKITKSVT